MASATSVSASKHAPPPQCAALAILLGLFLGAVYVWVNASCAQLESWPPTSNQVRQPWQVTSEQLKTQSQPLGHEAGVHLRHAQSQHLNVAWLLYRKDINLELGICYSGTWHLVPGI